MVSVNDLSEDNAIISRCLNWWACVGIEAIVCSCSRVVVEEGARGIGNPLLRVIQLNGNYRCFYAIYPS